MECGSFRVPAEIEKRNLLNHLRFLPSGFVGRPTLGKGTHKRLGSWYLWAEKNSISRQHTDAAGLGAFVWVLEGVKLWYFQPRREESDRLLWRARCRRAGRLWRWMGKEAIAKKRYLVSLESSDLKSN